MVLPQTRPYVGLRKAFGRFHVKPDWVSRERDTVSCG